MSFNDAALAINSYFDHTYPLLSLSLSEPDVNKNQITTFENENSTSKSYSSHDGYDYGRSAGATIGDPVLAAAGGCASYLKTGAGGNTIRIDHGNHYQTRYLHLQDDGLITKSTACVNVIQGQQIGKIGSTGNSTGAHIHFMVVEDKNGDGDFDDNIPDGVTDPFGWQSDATDPWPDYSWKYEGEEKDRTGNASFYLWTTAIANLSDQLTSNGGFFELERYRLNFPQDATGQDLNLEIQAEPNAKPSNLLHSIGSTIKVTAKDLSGNIVDSFADFFTVTIDFNPFDISSYDPNSLAIYSSEDGVNWTKEETTVDLNEKTASAQLNHLSYFALMAQRLDTTAPITTAVLVGNQGETNWFRSDVQLTLDAADHPGGLGIDYTMYKINDQDWQQYTPSLTFNTEGSYEIEFYSVDNDENIEDVKSITFDIDKTVPEAKVFIDQNLNDLVVIGVDQNQTIVTRASNHETKKRDDAIYTIADQADNTLKLDVRDRDRLKRDRFEIFSLTYNQDLEVTTSDNHYNVFYQGRKDKLNVKEQNFEIDGEVRIRIKYDRKKDQSTIITKEAGMEKVKEIKSGLILLLLNTNSGNLEYGY